MVGGLGEEDFVSRTPSLYGELLRGGGCLCLLEKMACKLERGSDEMQRQCNVVVLKVLTVMAGSPVYSTLMFPQKQLPEGMAG